MNVPKKYFLITADEKPKLLNVKNGSQIPANKQMPTLDPEPEQKDKKKIEEQKDTKPVEGDNGKVIAKDKVDITPDKVNDKSEDDEQDSKLPETTEPRWVETPDGQIEVEDADDYLIYLDDILKRIHK